MILILRGTHTFNLELKFPQNNIDGDLAFNFKIDVNLAFDWRIDENHVSHLECIQTWS